MPKTLVMPALSAGMEEGTIARWFKAEGDTIKRGEVIADIETDKATMELEAEQDGVLGSIVAGAGTVVAVNAPIAVLLLDGEHAAGLGVAETPAAPRARTVANLAPRASPDIVRTGAKRIAASPLARRLANERGISIDKLAGSGPRGRIVRLDVERASAAPTTATDEPHARTAPTPALSPWPDPPYREVRHSNIRKVIARRLTDAKATIPHFYLNAECEIDALLELRAKLNEHSNGAYKFSLNDFIIKAAALALRTVPEANATWTTDAVHFFDEVDISVAVATDDGLITPVVRQADFKRLATISAEVRRLADRAREGKLQPAEFQGGGFTISNLGMYGVQSFSAIINAPQSCILAVGAGQRRPVVRGDTCVPATLMCCTLSVDHRSVDGAVGARYLAAFKALVEQPFQLML